MLNVKLQKIDGVPAIFVNGVPHEAQMLYLSTPAPGNEWSRELFCRQIRMAAKTGVHMYTFHCTMDSNFAVPAEETNAYLRELMHLCIECDPEALILPRCSYRTSFRDLSKTMGWWVNPYADIYDSKTPDAPMGLLSRDDAVLFSDGRGMESDHSTFEEYSADPTCLGRESEKNPFADHISDAYRNVALMTLIRFIRAVRADPVLADHVFGYHYAAGMTSEMYQCRYWDGVLDLSESNQKGFRVWLRKKYRTDEALSAAWEREASLTDARIPEDLPGIKREYKPEILQLARHDRRTFDICEWYTWRSWDANLDFPDAYEYSLRVWLDTFYKSDEELSAAWGGKYSLSDNLVPEDFHDWFVDFHYEAIFSGKGWRRYADYLDYYSDQVAGLAEDAAATIKRETDGQSLSCFFYGYHYDVPSAQSGHHSLKRVLDCPDIDILCAPLSYYNRNEGGMGASMADVTSIHNAGKLWLDESDYRQPVVTGVPRGLDVCKSIKSLEGAHEIILRQCGRLSLYRMATWWMDLRGLGWYDSEELWQYIAEGRGYQKEMEAARKSSVADVVLLDDEKAMSYVGDAWRFADEIMNKSRNEMYYAGVSCDFCMLEDFLAGKLDGAKLYVFLNPFRILSAGKGEAVREALLRNHAAALWLHGFGPEDSEEDIRALTGFTLRREKKDAAYITVDGTQYIRRAEGEAFAALGGEKLGEYPDGTAAYAKTDAAGYPSYFLGGSRCYKEIIRKLAISLGANDYIDAGDMFCAIGNLSVLHTAAAGKKTLRFPFKTVRELRSGVTYPSEFTIDAPEYTTYLFIGE